jgi:hypothetical protein
MKFPLGSMDGCYDYGDHGHGVGAGLFFCFKKLPCVLSACQKKTLALSANEC